MNKTKSKLEIRIDWSDMDLFGHVNNVSFFKYVQASRVRYWENSRMLALLDKDKRGPLLAATSCKFLKPLFYPDNILVEVKVAFIKNTSYGLHHKIYNSADELCAEAEDVVVYFDYNKKEKIQLPDQLRSQLDENIGD